MSTTKTWKHKTKLVALAVAIAASAVFGALAAPTSAEVVTDVPSDTHLCYGHQEDDEQVILLIDHDLFNEHGCQVIQVWYTTNYGSWKSGEYGYAGKCTGSGAIVIQICGTPDQEILTLEEYDSDSGCFYKTGYVKKDCGGTSYGTSYQQSAVSPCHFYLESENEDVFFTRETQGNTSVDCDEITIYEESTDTTYRASAPPKTWLTAHEDIWPHPGDDDTDGVIDLQRCDNFTHFLELADLTADACSYMGEPIDADTRTITTAHNSLTTLPEIHVNLPNPEPGVAPNSQVYSIHAGDPILIPLEIPRPDADADGCTAGPQMTWKEGGKNRYGMAIPSHCVSDGIGTVVYKEGGGLAAVIGYDLTRHIGEVVAISDNYDLALVEYYWHDCNNIDCVKYEVRGNVAIRKKGGGIGLLWNRFRAVSGTYDWTSPESSIGHEFHGYGRYIGFYSGDFVEGSINWDEDGKLETLLNPVKGDSGGPIWDPILNSNWGESRTVPIAGMQVSSLPELGVSGFVRSDTILSFVQSEKGATANFVMWGN